MVGGRAESGGCTGEVGREGGEVRRVGVLSDSPAAALRACSCRARHQRSDAMAAHLLWTTSKLLIVTKERSWSRCSCIPGLGRVILFLCSENSEHRRAHVVEYHKGDLLPGPPSFDVGIWPAYRLCRTLGSPTLPPPSGDFV